MPNDVERTLMCVSARHTYLFFSDMSVRRLVLVTMFVFFKRNITYFFKVLQYEIN